MGERKNIDRLFQEQLKNFEETPGDHIWENIQEELELTNESKKKVFPFWYRFAGIAASLILLIGLVANLWTDETPDANTVIVNTDGNSKNERLTNDTEKNQLKDKLNPQEKLAVENDEINNSYNPERSNEAIVVQDSEILKTDDEKDNRFNSDNINNNDSYVKNSNAIRDEDILNKNSRGKVEFNSNEQMNPKEKGIIAQGNQENKQGINQVVNKNTNTIVFDESSGNNSKNLGNLSELNNDDRKESLVNNSQNKLLNSSATENGLAENSINTTDKNNNKQVGNAKEALLNTNSSNKETKVNKELVGTNTKKETNKTNINEDKTISNEKSLETSVVTNNLIDKEKLEKTFNSDGESKENPVVENSSENSKKKSESSEDKVDEETEEEKLLTIEEAIAEQKNKEETEEEKKDEENVLENKWQVRPNIAPVYYNSLSSGSPIDEQFKGNKKKGEVNMSYGVNVSYNLNKKLRVRTGINKVELGYNTENVAVVPAAEGASIDYIKNVTMSSGASQLNISSADGFSVSQIPSSFQNLFDASISQKFGYLEVPLELSYQVSDKKLSIDLIAGMSTFFLDKNEVHAKTNSFTTYLGEANNLNKTSFSTNFGVGFNYKISKAFHLNVEPTFKYQLNSFSSDAGNFKPYILGVYSGLSFKF